MENYEIITNLIATTGFPIAACIGLFAYMEVQQKKTNEILIELKATIDAVLEFVKDKKE